MYCGFCGKQMDDQMKFCPYCGKQIASPKTSSSEKRNSGKDNSYSIMQIILFALGGTVAFLLMVFGFILFFLKDVPHTESTAENKNTTTSQNSSTHEEKEAELYEANGLKKVSGSDYLYEMATPNGTMIFGMKSMVFIGVSDVAETKTLGNRFYGKSAQGRFVLVSVKVLNGQKDAITFSSANNKLIDNKGREYSSSSDGELAYMIATDSSRDNSLLSEINPGNAGQYILVFDVPSSVKLEDLKLKTRAGFSGGTMILPFNFANNNNSDTKENKTSSDALQRK